MIRRVLKKIDRLNVDKTKLITEQSKLQKKNESNISFKENTPDKIVEEYVDLINKKSEFKIQDIIKILDEYEKFYKNVCEKYIDTMSKEMLLEIDNKILHIYIEDRYINLKGKVQVPKSAKNEFKFAPIGQLFLRYVCDINYME